MRIKEIFSKTIYYFSFILLTASCSSINYNVLKDNSREVKIKVKNGRSYRLYVVLNDITKKRFTNSIEIADKYLDKSCCI